MTATLELIQDNALYMASNKCTLDREKKPKPMIYDDFKWLSNLFLSAMSFFVVVCAI